MRSALAPRQRHKHFRVDDSRIATRGALGGHSQVSTRSREQGASLPLEGLGQWNEIL